MVPRNSNHTVTRFVRKALTREGYAEHMLEDMVAAGMLKCGENGTFIPINLTEARKRDFARFPQVLRTCIQHRSREGEPDYEVTLDPRLSMERLLSVQRVLEQVVN